MARIGDFALHTLATGHIAESRARLQEVQIQVSTGKVSRDYAGVASDSRRLISIESAHSSATAFVGKIEQVDQRLQLMESNVSAIFDMATGFRSTLVAAANAPTGADTNVDGEAQEKMKQLASLLNVQSDGRYLFAGTRTNVVPVDINDPLFLPPGGTYPSNPNIAYYKGDSTKLTVRADQNSSVTYGVTADESAFEKTMRALHLASNAVAGSTVDQTRIDEALRVMNEALDELPDVRTRIGNARNTLDLNKTQHEEFMLYAEQTIGDIENVDVTEAITRLTNEEVQLEASLLAVARLGNLSLINFLG